MKDFNISYSEIEWQRIYAENFYDCFAYDEIKNNGKLISNESTLLDFAYESAKSNFFFNKKENPEELAKHHFNQFKNTIKK